MNDSMNDTVQRKFMVLAAKKPEFEKAMAKLAKRAAKLGCAAPTYTMAAEPIVVERDYKDFDGELKKRLVEVYETTVEGTPVKYAGWIFVASLEHLSEGETLVRSVSDKDLPERFRAAGPVCEHCNLDRKRRDTYVVMNEAGAYKQIGKTCIADFLGHKNPEQLASAAEILADAMGWDEGYGGEYLEDIADTLEFITVVITLVRLYGYASKKVIEERGSGITTGAQAMQVLFPGKDRDQKKFAEETRAAITDADRNKAQAAIDWILGMEGELNDFLYNVRTVIKQGRVKSRTKGYAAALTVAYARAMDEIKERVARPVSKHVGEIGQRLIFTATIRKVIALESQWGVTHLHIMTDAEGNDLKWFGAGGLGDEDETVTFKGTVKAHEEYKGRAQTIVSRCALYTPPAPKVKKPRAKKGEKAAAEVQVPATDEGAIKDVAVAV